MGNSRIARTAAIGAPLTAAAAVLALTTVPAHAVDQITTSIASGVGLPLASSAYPQYRAMAVGYQAAVSGEGDFVVTYDTSGLAGIATFSPGSAAPGTLPHTCAQQGTLYVCTGHQAAGGTGFSYRDNPSLEALGSAQLGQSGHLKVTRTWKGGASDTTDVTVAVGGPQFEVKPLPTDVSRYKGGDTVEQAVRVTNQGNLASGRLVVGLTLTPGLNFQQKFANCSYGDYKSSQPFHGTAAAICTINTSVQPGQTVKLDTLKFGLDIDPIYAGVEITASPNEEGALSWMGDKFDFSPASGTGSRFTAGLPEDAIPAPGQPSILFGSWEPNSSRRFGDYWTDTKADVALSGSWAPVGDGTTGTLTVKAHNSGPGSVTDRAGVVAASILVRFASEVTPGDLPAGCVAVPDSPRPVAACNLPLWFANGADASFTLPVTVDNPTKPNTVGLVLTTGAAAGDDMVIPLMWTTDILHNPSASVQLTGTGPGTTSPSPSASAEPSTSAEPSAEPSTEPTDSASPSPSASTAPNNSPAPSVSPAPPAADRIGYSTVGLAFTGGGQGATTVAGLGFAAIALGGGALALTRRRKAGTRA